MEDNIENKRKAYDKFYYRWIKFTENGGVCLSFEKNNINDKLIEELNEMGLAQRSEKERTIHYSNALYDDFVKEHEPPKLT